MRLADYSAQKMAREGFSCSCGKHHGKKTELIFCTWNNIGETLKERFPAYKTLFVSDSPIRAKARKYLSPDCLCLYCQDHADMRELFAFPDTVTLLVVYAKKEVVEIARYFACVRGIKCVVVCADADATPILSEEIGLSLLGRQFRYFLPPPELVFFSQSDIDASQNARVFLEIAVHTVCVLEKKFSRCILQENGCEELYELAYDILLGLSSVRNAYSPVCKLFEESFRYAFLRAEGFFDTETEYLWRTLSEGEKLSAWESCIELFSVFFRYGKIRKYSCADYIKRFQNAAVYSGASELAISESCPIPSVLQISEYAERFERERAGLIRFAEDQKQRRQSILDTYCFFGGTVREEKVSPVLKMLPELSGKYGVFSLMRDFGLLN